MKCSQMRSSAPDILQTSGMASERSTIAFVVPGSLTEAMVSYQSKALGSFQDFRKFSS